ncbi:MAG: ribose 5-phosphate isomerase B [Alphaproteobacteria bacterium]|nr:ribose 5-phosphate isomerase B [Alphaproteobacteria bacterium]
MNDPSPTGRAEEGPTIWVASDHAGLAMKRDIAAWLAQAGWRVIDLGPDEPASVDYPDYANRLAEALKDKEEAFGVLVCGTGIGISMAANRHRHVRAALCHNATDARLARQHNDANVIALGARTLGPEIALDCVSAFLDAEFEGGRHAARVAKMS